SWPADTVVSCAVFTMVRSGHWTVTLSWAMTTAWFVAFALATLWYRPHESNVVALVTCAEAPVPLARSPKLHESVSLATLQPALSVDHETPVPVGSGSSSVTPYAAPGPLLLTQIVKPMLSPALTVPASASFTMPRFGQSTVAFAVDCCDWLALRLVVRNAVLIWFAQSPRSAVSALMWMARPSKTASDPKAQLRVWDGALPVIEQLSVTLRPG